MGQVYARRPTLRQRAIDYFQKALQADTARAETYYNMAAVYRDMGSAQVVDMARHALDINPNYGAPYRLLADYYAAGDWYATQAEDDLAARYYTRYLTLEPDDVDAAVQLGRVLLRLGDSAGLKRTVLPFLKTHPQASTDLLPVAGQSAYKKEQYETSAASWQRYLDRLDEGERTLYISPQPILTQPEAETCAALTPDARQAFAHQFWPRQDLDPTTEVNERLLEHYARVWLARQSFAQVAYP